MEKLIILCCLQITLVSAKAQVNKKLEAKVIGSRISVQAQSPAVLKNIDYYTAQNTYGSIGNKSLPLFTSTEPTSLSVKQLQSFTLKGHCAPNAVVLLSGSIMYYDPVNVFSVDSKGKPTYTTVVESIQLTCSNSTQNGQWSIAIKSRIPLKATDVRVRLAVGGYATVNGVLLATKFSAITIPIVKANEIVTGELNQSGKKFIKIPAPKGPPVN